MPKPELEELLDDMFRYHAPTELDVIAYTKMRDAGKHLARSILENTPKCADQTAAIRKVREAIMTANAARALGGAV